VQWCVLGGDTDRGSGVASFRMHAAVRVRGYAKLCTHAGWGVQVSISCFTVEYFICCVQLC
jgi:hypothetical protein